MSALFLFYRGSLKFQSYPVWDFLKAFYFLRQFSYLNWDWGAVSAHDFQENKKLSSFRF